MSTDAVHESLMIVFSAPATDADEDEFNSWYDHVHIPELIKHVPGITRATRYRVAPQSDQGEAHPYMAIYELSTSAAEVLRDMGRAAPRLTQSATMDTSERPPKVTIYHKLG